MYRPASPRKSPASPGKSPASSAPPASITASSTSATSQQPQHAVHYVTQPALAALNARWSSSCSTPSSADAPRRSLLMLTPFTYRSRNRQPQSNTQRCRHQPRRAFRHSWNEDTYHRLQPVDHKACAGKWGVSPNADWLPWRGRKGPPAPSLHPHDDVLGPAVAKD